MKTSTAFRSLFLAAVFAFGSLAMLPVQEAVAQSKQKPPQVTEKVRKLLSAALEAAKNKQFDVAEAKITEAQAFEKKKPFDEFNIYEVQGFVYANQEKYVAGAAAYEKMLAMPEFLVPAQHDGLVKKITIYYFQAKDYPKVVEFGTRWVQDHPEDTDILEILGQAHYQVKDYKKARECMSNAVAIAERDGKTPKEYWLKYLQALSVELEDAAGITGAYEKMARYYPKPETWERLLARLSHNERSERVMLQWLRLMGEVGVLKQDDQYAEYAQLAMESALPGEAARMVEAGYAKNLLGVDAKEKVDHQRLRDRAKSSAQADKAQLPQLEKEAQAANATAGSIAGLGLAYFSYEQYDQAVPALEAGLKKGGLKNVDDYTIALGISQLRLGQKDLARATFKSVAADSLLAKVANTWVIRSYN